ncbi:HAD-IA family hydrolase [Gellertiella hungarica]|uniref:Phosphoglycolate phosphatase n=1 Tax=Gellertiella hungarica TaxID=1572859 RepID=A0A7W6J5V4_9HYPH|nr:phosphoglycolate phosphatase [Gellertiella hungarica]
MAAPLAVFDLDGTLIDTAPDLVDSLNHTIDAAGLAPVTYDDLTHLVGHGARAMIERSFALRGRPLSDGEYPAMLERFITHYQAGMPGKGAPYPGLLDALDRLSAAGWKIAVCTNKMEGLARRLIETNGLTERFAAITGGDTFTVRKPDAAHLFGTVERAGADPRRTVMIGDSLNDILVARNAGVPSIAVPFGYSDRPIAELQPSHIIGHYDELTVDLLDRLLG